MKIKMLFLLLFLLSPLYSYPVEGKLVVDVTTSVTAIVQADEMYVLFLLEESAASVAEAHRKVDGKLNAVTANLKQEFPHLKDDCLSVHTGPGDIGDDSFIPMSRKVVIYTLPSDESVAARLLDAGAKAGLTPFCGRPSWNSGTHGAVFYALRKPEPELNQLYSAAIEKLWKDAKSIIGVTDSAALKLQTVNRYRPLENEYEVSHRNITVALPAVFCGSDPNHIRIEMVLNGEFETIFPTR